MDPQREASLDAKLKKAYDSVMEINTSQETPPLPLSPQESTTEPVATPVSNIQTISPPPTTSTPQSYFQPDPIPESAITPNKTNELPIQNIDNQSRKFNFRWILVAFTIAGFILGYSILWRKVFGIEIPFISSFF